MFSLLRRGAQGATEPKRLDKLAFWLFLLGAGVAITYFIIDMVFVLLVLTGMSNMTIGILSFVAFLEPSAGGDLALMSGIIRWIFIGFGILVMLAFAIVLLIYVKFVLRLIRHRSTERDLLYMGTTVKVALVWVVISLVAVVQGGFVSLAMLLANVAILAGFFLQWRSVREPQVEAAPPVSK